MHSVTIKKPAFQAHCFDRKKIKWLFVENNTFSDLKRHYQPDDETIITVSPGFT